MAEIYNPLDHGFETGKIIMPGLEIEVELKPNQYFRNDGVVGDLVIYTARVVKELNAVNPPPQWKLKKGEGINISRTNSSDQLSVIAVKKKNPVYCLFNQGHESTHALRYFGLEHHLHEALEEKGFKPDFCKEYKDEEAIANIGGILALYKIGCSLMFIDGIYGGLTPLIVDLIASRRD